MVGEGGLNPPSACQLYDLFTTRTVSAELDTQLLSDQIRDLQFPKISPGAGIM